MPAPRLPWIKFWPEALDHEKFAELSDSESWTWVVVWAKASQQPRRWRFASVAHAAKISGRPKKFITKLISVGLLDECEDGIWVHDWQEWQDSSAISRTAREGWLNGGHRVAEQPSNGGRMVENRPPKGDLEEEVEREGDREEDSPSLRSGAAATKIRGNPRVQLVIDALRERGLEEVAISARDAAAVKHSTAPPESIAEVYDAVAHGQFGDDFMRKRLSIHEAVEWVNAYAQRNTRDPPDDAECSCAQRLEWLKVNRNTNPNCELHGDVRDHPAPGAA